MSEWTGKIYSVDTAQDPFPDDTQIFLRRPEQVDGTTNPITIGPWDSTAARWKHDAPKPPRRKRPLDLRRKRKSSKTLAGSWRHGTSGRPSACRCCSRRQSAARSRRGIGSSGCAARPAGPRRRSTCGPLIATRGPRSLASSRRCRVATVGRTRRSLSSSASLTKASLTRCATNTRGTFSGDKQSGPAATGWLRVATKAKPKRWGQHLGPRFVRQRGGRGD